MICSKCSSLPLTNAKNVWNVEHYSTFAGLEKSVQNGCEVCALLRTVLLDYYAQGLSRSIEEAANYHRQWDQRLESRGGEHFGSEESAPGRQDSRSSTFLVEAVLSEDSEPQFQGLRGLLYLRFGAESPEPIDEMYPFVQVCSFPDSIALREWHVIGRQITTTPDMSLAKRWIGDCITSHPICPNSWTSPLPSRILDLGLSDDSRDLKLRVDVNCYGCYATLSHCWGKSQPLKLKQDSYNEFQNKIPYESLPKTFQDAVTTTRSLGLRYLWIDSLCIVQDSDRDWEEQCAEMKRIYKNSFVTLAGSASSDCHDGFLHPRPASYDVTIQLSDSRGPCQLVLSHYGIDENPHYPSPEPNSPLSKRAWVLQERLLSGRVLYFGPNQMYLECFTNVRFDNCYYPTMWDFQSVDMVVKSAIDQLESRMKCFDYWTTIIATYSGLHLTKITDRLPALSGLASTFQSVTNSQYLAGLWREDMPSSLAWYVPFWENAAAVSMSTSSAYIAPSWSWAAARFGVITHSLENHSHKDMDIIATRLSPAGIDPFGMVKDGFIDVSGRIQRALLKELPDLVVRGRRTFYTFDVQLGNSDSSHLAIYAPDDVNRVESREFKVWMLYLGTTSAGWGVAMAIKPVDGELDTYERVGLAFSGLPGHGSGNVMEIFQNVAKTRIRLI